MQRPKSNRKEWEKVIAYIAERATKLAEEALDNPDLVPDRDDVIPHIKTVFDKLEPHVLALLDDAVATQLDGEGVHPKNFFPDALARTIRRRINAV